MVPELHVRERFAFRSVLMLSCEQLHITGKLINLGFQVGQGSVPNLPHPMGMCEFVCLFCNTQTHFLQLL